LREAGHQLEQLLVLQVLVPESVLLVGNADALETLGEAELLLVRAGAALAFFVNDLLERYYFG
jgi:hypothetical protein